MADIEHREVPERFNLGVFDTGEIAGVYPMTSVSGRADMKMTECVRADLLEGAVDALREIRSMISYEHAPTQQRRQEACALIDAAIAAAEGR